MSERRIDHYTAQIIINVVSRGETPVGARGAAAEPVRMVDELAKVVVRADNTTELREKCSRILEAMSD